jgi:hypothetical protein
MIAPITWAHVVYRTRRFEAMITWYQTVFAARVQDQNPRRTFAVLTPAVVPMFQGLPLRPRR